MYEAADVLASIDENKWKIIGLCAFAMLCNYTWFFISFRQARIDGVYSIPMFATFFWLAGDASMVWRFDTWFNVIDHWYVKLFWLALVFTVMFELLYVRQVLRYGRKELRPEWTQAQWTAAVIAGVGVGVLAWSVVKHAIGDPLYITYFHLANLAGPVFGAALLIRRGNRAGQNPVVWGAYTLMVASWFTACFAWYGPPFRDFEFVALYVVTTAAAAAMTYVTARMPAYTPPVEAPAPAVHAGGARVGAGAPAR